MRWQQNLYVRIMNAAENLKTSWCATREALLYSDKVRMHAEAIQ